MDNFYSVNVQPQRSMTMDGYCSTQNEYFYSENYQNQSFINSTPIYDNDNQFYSNSTRQMPSNLSKPIQKRRPGPKPKNNSVDNVEIARRRNYTRKHRENRYAERERLISENQKMKELLQRFIYSFQSFQQFNQKLTQEAIEMINNHQTLFPPFNLSVDSQSPDFSEPVSIDQSGNLGQSWQ